MSDTRKLLTAQALRALLYGFSAILLGATLGASGLSQTEVGLLLTAIVAGMGLMSFLVGTYGDRIGRRSTYCALFAGLALTGLVFALTSNIWILCAVGLTGTLSTSVSESGPFTSLEQTMLPAGLIGHARTRVFGIYNAVAAAAGSLGALAAGGPSVLRHVWPALPADRRLFLVFIPVGLAGAATALSLSSRVELDGRRDRLLAPLHRSRSRVLRLAGLFAADSFAGGFVVDTFVAFWLQRRFNVPLEVLGAVFFCTGLLQAGSYLVATRLAARIGLLNTMVFTHLPSNVLLMLVPLAPTLPLAIALLLLRFALSQMDVPTRQAYLVAMVDPTERTAAAGYTNTARNLTRPAGPLLGGLSQQVAFGLPFVLAGGIKAVYDLSLWAWFRRVPLE